MRALFPNFPASQTQNTPEISFNMRPLTAASSSRCGANSCHRLGRHSLAHSTTRKRDLIWLWPSRRRRHIYSAWKTPNVVGASQVVASARFFLGPRMVVTSVRTSGARRVGSPSSSSINYQMSGPCSQMFDQLPRALANLARFKQQAKELKQREIKRLY